MISIDSIFFIGLLIIAPIVFHAFRQKVCSKYFFLLINAFVYLCTIQTIEQGIVSFIWLLLPFVYLQVFEKKAPIILFLICGFVYLNRYDWIIMSIGLPYLFTFKIFGLSYILFKQIDYIIQYDKKDKSDTKYDVVNYMNYLLSFYTIISGPIQRFDEFVNGMRKMLPPLEIKPLLLTLNRILNGYLKIMVASYFCNKIAQSQFTLLQQTLQVSTILIFAFANMAFIYFNFSGYCDVVIGFAKIAGIILPENFNKPYLAQDVNDFWSRQHITLTKWITDYVFTPFVRFVNGRGMPFQASLYISFFVAFLFAGLWHGSTINYLIYGLLQAVGVCLTQIYVTLLKKKFGKKKAIKEFRSKRLIKSIEILVTQTYIALSFVFIGYDIVGMFFG